MAAKDIRCFQHCDRKKKILCFNVPLLCPLCRKDVTQTEMRIPPYLLESPFTNGTWTQCCVLVKPTVGNFLYGFNNDSNLHIGLSSSTGIIYEYDERGVTVGASDWTSCLSLKILDISQKVDKLPIWDSELMKYGKQPCWLADSYDVKLHNCYDFVLGFLQSFGLKDVFSCLKDKSQFCEEIILPVTSKAGKYISLYRNIDMNGYLVQNTN